MDATQRITNGLLTMAMVAALIGCEATESHKRLDVEGVASRWSSYSGPKHKLAIGQFENKSPYMKGIFSDGKDRLGLQARQILKTHLSQTNRFVLLDRTNLKEIERETDFSGRERRITGGDVVLTGAVTEFGRRETGGQSLWGILGKSKKQVAYAKVSISIVDTATSQVLYSAQGAGEFDLSSSDVLGFGSKAGYDATLNDKVLNLAVIEAVDRLVEGLEGGQWQLVE